MTSTVPSTIGFPIHAGTKILGIETSCDETAAAVVVGGHQVRSSVVSSQVDIHARFGGVVPEIASRAHVDLLTPVVAQALVESGLDGSELDAVAATTGPGLVGSLLVGVSSAKALALVWGVPFVAVNHLEAHLYAALVEDPSLELPLVVLLVSGGHDARGHGGPRPPRFARFHPRRRATGEAFDKVARYLGLERIPAVRPSTASRWRATRKRSRFRVRCTATASTSPSPGPEDGGHQPRPQAPRGEHRRCRGQLPGGGGRRAGRQGPPCCAPDRGRRAWRSAVAVMAANSVLLERFLSACVEDGIHGFLPSRAMCTDNAAMVAAADVGGRSRDGRGRPGVVSRLRRGSRARAPWPVG
ncbi:MAG: tRNA (adenosine(37)-N6)-threonylcarbamoyltransferase complex transferase subunit TsaD [Acidimicrobiales bacterium]